MAARRRISPGLAKAGPTPVVPAAPEMVLSVMRLTMTWGEEHIQPIQFNGFRYGGISIEVDVPPGQLAAVAKELAAKLEEMGEEQFKRKLEGYVERLREANDYVHAAPAKS